MLVRMGAMLLAVRTGGHCDWLILTRPITSSQIEGVWDSKRQGVNDGLCLYETGCVGFGVSC